MGTEHAGLLSRLQPTSRIQYFPCPFTPGAMDVPADPVRCSAQRSRHVPFCILVSFYLLTKAAGKKGFGWDLPLEGVYRGFLSFSWGMRGTSPEALQILRQEWRTTCRAMVITKRTLLWSALQEESTCELYFSPDPLRGSHERWSYKELIDSFPTYHEGTGPACLRWFRASGFTQP